MDQPVDRGRAKKRILVVDDSRVIRLVVRRMLESLGFAVDEAAHGRSAIDHCQRLGPPDGILLDVNMPEMDGLECLRIVRSDPSLATCPVIMCTTEVELDRIAEAVAGGANEYIMKPFTNDIVVEKLRQVGLLE